MLEKRLRARIASVSPPVQATDASIRFRLLEYGHNERDDREKE